MKTKEIWHIYSDELKYFIVGKVKDKAIADDILQDVFIKIHTKLHTLKETSKLKSWVFSITRNSILDYFKTTNRSFEIINIESDSNIEDSLHTKADCLIGILKKLPKKYREPLFLSDIKGIKQTEIAKQLNIPISTVKSQIQRARKMVAKGFMDCCGFVKNDKGILVGKIKDRGDCKICK